MVKMTLEKYSNIFVKMSLGNGYYKRIRLKMTLAEKFVGLKVIKPLTSYVKKCIICMLHSKQPHS